MTLEKAVVNDRKPISLGNKLNPSWCLVGPDGRTAPQYNHGGTGIEPYLHGRPEPAAPEPDLVDEKPRR
jgi:hypothetical protein